MNNFMDALENLQNEKLTENGQFALKSTKSSLIDLFGTIGALRARSDSDICELFEKAFCEDNLLAMKILFYSRDILEGLGERNTFRVIIKYLAKNHTAVMKKNLNIIPEFGRWDDFYEFVGTPLEADAFNIMKTQFEKDYYIVISGAKMEVSLLAKWLKSINTSSIESRRLGRLTAKYFNLTERIYRKRISKIRKYLDVVEIKMSAQNWDKINYSGVPSKAANIYHNAFETHDEVRYLAYIESLKQGESKINAKAIMPYDIIKPYTDPFKGKEYDEVIEQQWKALPNFVTNENKFLVMADVSGSMTGLPMDTAVSLAIYFAERNTGVFHNKYMTFSSNPTLQIIKDGETLKSKADSVLNSEWGMGTNLERAFSQILKAAIKGHATQDEIPSALVVITDMEINYCVDDTTFTDEMKKRFEDAGYKMPIIVWWNVNARNNTFHANYTDESVRFISGSSAAVFKSLCENIGTSPIELMLNTLNDKRYDCVKI